MGEINENMKILRTEFQNIIDRIDTGSCYMTEDGTYDLIKMLKYYFDDSLPSVPRDVVGTYLGKSTAYIIDHEKNEDKYKIKFPKGYKRMGITETLWSKKDIEEYSKKTGKKNKFGISLESLLKPKRKEDTMRKEDNNG